ncbi:hypothetical protein BX070DRAFT_225675 [Coemansia spiralis]|nr:hypothetical protein BX070DRAFT_225675 [Coemansia spiralis]
MARPLVGPGIRRCRPKYLRTMSSPCTADASAAMPAEGETTAVAGALPIRAVGELAPREQCDDDVDADGRCMPSAWRMAEGRAAMELSAGGKRPTCGGASSGDSACVSLKLPGAAWSALCSEYEEPGRSLAHSRLDVDPNASRSAPTCTWGLGLGLACALWPSRAPRYGRGLPLLSMPAAASGRRLRGPPAPSSAPELSGVTGEAVLLEPDSWSRQWLGSAWYWMPCRPPRCACLPDRLPAVRTFVASRGCGDTSSCVPTPPLLRLLALTLVKIRRGDPEFPG